MTNQPLEEPDDPKEAVRFGAVSFIDPSAYDTSDLDLPARIAFAVDRSILLKYMIINNKFDARVRFGYT